MARRMNARPTAPSRVGSQPGKFSVDGFSAIRTGAFDAPNTPVALVGLSEKSGDLGDGLCRGAVAELHVLSVLWVSGPQRLPLGGLARRLARLLMSLQ